jgi:hypothetical protein
MTKLSVLISGATGYISQRDLQQLFCKSIGAPEIADESGVDALWRVGMPRELLPTRNKGFAIAVYAPNGPGQL